MGHLVDTILHLSGPAAYGLVGLLAFGEAAAFLGLVVPGELAVLLGGVIASSGNASLPVMVVVGLRWATRRLLARTDQVRARLHDLAARPAMQSGARRFAVPLAWVRARTTPGAARGLGWTPSLGVAGGAAWVTGIAVQDLLAREELFLLDQPVTTWIAAHTTPAATRITEVGVDVVSPPWGLWAVLVLAGLAWRWADRHAGVRVIVAAVLAAGLQGLLPTSVAGTTFPAGSVTWLTAATVAAVAAIATPDLTTAIRLASACIGILLLSATAELVAGDAALSGIVGALGIGGVLGAGGELTARTLASADPTTRPSPAYP